jgi:S1-C subfamily serine protease
MRVSAVLFLTAAALVRKTVTDYDPLRYSVVRIQAVATQFDWMHPFFGGSDGVGLGTGWVVEMEPEPVFVTNAHVVSNAHSVMLQLLVHSSQKWEAQVVSICQTFDLALLVLKDKDSFFAALGEKNMQLKALPVSRDATSMGLPVVALGFPLGQDSLKISAGVVAGNEEVQGNVCIQSTAPISPGSSGGPLLTDDGASVVGVNFAKSADSSAENINYVIPGWRVLSMVSTFKARLAESGGVHSRRAVRVPSADAVTIQPNDALRALARCDQGLFLASFGPKSFFRQAQPPVPGRSFLTKVNGVEIDQFGMGVNRAYCDDQVLYTDLFFMQDDLEKAVEVEVCHDGQRTTHEVPLAWLEAYESGVQYVDEPSYEDALTQFELFGDVSVMQLTLNHIETLYKHMPDLAAFLRPEESGTSRLVVHFVEPGSYASEFLSPGSVITKLNGHPVSTLADFRKHFIPDALRSGAATEDGADEDTDADEDTGAGDAVDDADTDEDAELSFLATRHRKGKGPVAWVRAAAPAGGSSKPVWTLETDRGEMYAVFFGETLLDQVARAEAQQSPTLLSAAVLDAAVQLHAFGNGSGSLPPFVRSMLDHGKKAASMVALPRAAAVPAAEPEALALSISADIPTVQRSGWRPTIQHSVPRGAEL